jgi:predicted nucleic acid-binding protein
VVVPWPVFAEVDLLLRARGHASAAIAFGRALLEGVHRLDAPTDTELRLALDLADRYPDTGVDLPDLTVMAMASIRGAWILTWDYGDFRTVVLGKDHHWELLVQESELPVTGPRWRSTGFVVGATGIEPVASAVSTHIDHLAHPWDATAFG